MNVITLLEMAADAYGDRAALTCGDVTLGYASLLAAARNLAAVIRRQDIGAVGYLAVSSPAAPIALFAAAAAGVPYVPLNYRLTPEELSALVARIDPAILIVDAEYVSSLALPATVHVMDRRALESAAGEDEAIEPMGGEEDIAVQLFTSGTTGQPKAAILRHKNLFSYIIGSVEFASAQQDEATLVSVPPYHIAGVSAVMSSIYAGRRIVQLPNFDVAEWLRLCRSEHVTNAFLVPTMLNRIVDYLDGRGEAAEAPQLRSIAYGGGRMPSSVIERAMVLFPDVDFTNAYGLTETSSTICLLGPDDHRHAVSSGDARIRRRLASVGRSLPSVEIEIRDEAGRAAGPEITGRVFVRGAQVSGEYGGLGRMLDDEGWFDTRDRGFLDSQGYLFLDGRADDVIVRGGENISPGEVEAVLLAHPAVSDVAVVGIADEDWGEAVAAAVVLGELRVEPADLQEWVRSRLRSSRVPQRIRFVDELPYNDLGKLLRRVVRAEF
jgi:acyl-CoA synthetase (AMP-forming)/AMP-acid ligase II